MQCTHDAQSLYKYRYNTYMSCSITCSQLCSTLYIQHAAYTTTLYVCTGISMLKDSKGIGP